MSDHCLGILCIFIFIGSEAGDLSEDGRRPSLDRRAEPGVPADDAVRPAHVGRGAAGFAVGRPAGHHGCGPQDPEDGEDGAAGDVGLRAPRAARHGQHDVPEGRAVHQPGQAQHRKVLRPPKHCQGPLRIHLLPREQRPGGAGPGSSGDDTSLM